MSRRHTHPVFIPQENIAEGNAQHERPEENVEQPLAAIDAKQPEENDEQPLAAIDADQLEENVEQPYAAIDVDQLPRQPAELVDVDYQIAQDLQFAFLLELEDEDGEDAPIRERSSRAQRATARLNYLNCVCCDRHVQAEYDAKDFMCFECAKKMN